MDIETECHLMERKARAQHNDDKEAFVAVDEAGGTVRHNKRKRRGRENRQPGGKTSIETKEERRILEIETNEEASSKSIVKKIS